MCGRRPEKVICDWESVWAEIHETFCSQNGLLQPIQKVLTRKSSQVLDQRSHCASDHAHEPLGIQILARTLLPGPFTYTVHAYMYMYISR